jgi:hypothetical protein
MKNIPVDTSVMRVVQFIGAEPRLDEDGDPRNGRNGRPTYRVGTSVVMTDANGALVAETLDVTVEVGEDGVVPGSGLSLLDTVEFIGLVARPWSMGDRSGVTFSCAEIRAASRKFAAGPSEAGVTSPGSASKAVPTRSVQ